MGKNEECKEGYGDIILPGDHSGIHRSVANAKVYNLAFYDYTRVFHTTTDYWKVAVIREWWWWSRGRGVVAR